MLVAMITTLQGIVLPSVSPLQKMAYYNNPDLLAYSRDSAAERRSTSYQIATHQNISRSGQKGRDFASAAVAAASWYSPPKGTTVNTYA